MGERVSIRDYDRQVALGTEFLRQRDEAREETLRLQLRCADYRQETIDAIAARDALMTEQDEASQASPEWGRVVLLLKLVVELKAERDEARDAARRMLHIARSHGAKPFGLTKVGWLEEEEFDMDAGNCYNTGSEMGKGPDA